MSTFVAYSYNHTQICKGFDLKNVSDEADFYERVTGNKTYIIWKEETV